MSNKKIEETIVSTVNDLNEGGKKEEPPKELVKDPEPVYGWTHDTVPEGRREGDGWTYAVGA